MRRPTNAGEICRRSAGKKWYGYFRRFVTDPKTNEPKTISTPIALCFKSEMTKCQAREKLEQEIKRLTGQIGEDGVVKNGSVTFGWFVRNRYLRRAIAR
jgi:hypothetical protein